MRRSIFFVIIVFLLVKLVHDLNGQTDHVHDQSQKTENDHEERESLHQIYPTSLPSPSRLREVSPKKVPLPELCFILCKKEESAIRAGSVTTCTCRQHLNAALVDGVFSLSYFSLKRKSATFSAASKAPAVRILSHQETLRREGPEWSEKTWRFCARGWCASGCLRWPLARHRAAACVGRARQCRRPTLELPCRAACLIDQQTGTVLYEKNADQQMHIASLTKVMTLLLTFEAVHNGQLTMDTPVPVSEHAYHMGGSQIWLEPGEQFTLDEMIKAICVSSANDAAVAVAELVGGSEQGFVQSMNARAAELGMTNTVFHNACGLDTEGHLSTARDVAVMSRYILNTCPEVLHYTGIWTDTLRGGATQLVNTNKLLRRYNGITGLKTGTTSGAGVCISASATRDGLDLIAVVLGAPSSSDRFDAATTLLDYGFAAYRAVLLPAVEDQPLLIKVKGSAEESVPLDYSALPGTLLMPKEGGAALTARVDLPDTLDAPVQQGQAVGTVRVLSGETLLGEYEIRAAADAPKMDFGTAFGLLWDALTGRDD